ncbi:MULTISPECIES: Dabb family protein [unclassified Breznakia]|uniref:Dabb family protein n=1 Tax=unclassified Breznakia TaxID=2623764 RepID=UPI002476DFEE|nr:MULTISPECIES: Dabb family protein [unclassified Breznakia]MDH6368164.1 hypothetical protein [Breznakia sp. PH1-1]MDH6405243.1 hypothetical protein [Breznakia sp. PF1-11]MDH6412967.1 hypothetical protein [Breznakia sp. PFB1-11]MDH6415319.1 hypothetical protein [Breznakia sp. PFB1-14]MDH6417633.1 hypothetical protein [Breznakia sp. PFB1-4]
MIRHVVMWKFHEGVEVSDFAQDFHAYLEETALQMPGVKIDQFSAYPLPSSNMDMILVSTFVDESQIELYQNHPIHKKATALLEGKVASRSCVDYEINIR